MAEQHEGLARLREAADTQHTAVLTWRQARAVLDHHDQQVADQHTAAIEVEHLTSWKAEATALFDGLQDLGRALGLPLGTLVTGPDAVAAAQALHDARDEAVGRARRLSELLDGATPPVDPPPRLCDPTDDEPPLECEVLCCPAARPHDVGDPGCVTQRRSA